MPQRAKNIAEAKELMAAAGMANGFETTLTTEKYLEIPDYAVLIQNAVKEIGGNIKLNVLDQGAYYGDAVPGKSPWLDSDMGITDYGHRGVPNVFLSAPLRSDGTWNSAHFKNAGLRRAGDQLYRLARPGIAARQRRQDPDPAARRDAADLHLLLRLPDGDEEGSDRRRADGDGPSVMLKDARASLMLSDRLRQSAGEGAGGRGDTIVFLLKRVALSLVTLWLLSVLVFAGGQLLPGNIGRAMLGPFADERAVEVLNHEMGTDRPVLVQYADWIGDFVQGDHGQVLCLSRAGGAVPANALLNSAKLALVAFLWWCRSASSAGSSPRSTRAADRSHHHRSAGLSATIVPEFVSGIVLILIFGVWLRWLPISATWPAGAGLLRAGLSPDPASDAAGS